MKHTSNKVVAKKDLLNVILKQKSLGEKLFTLVSTRDNYTSLNLIQTGPVSNIFKLVSTKHIYTSFNLVKTGPMPTILR